MVKFIFSLQMQQSEYIIKTLLKESDEMTEILQSIGIIARSLDFVTILSLGIHT